MDKPLFITRPIREDKPSKKILIFFIVAIIISMAVLALTLSMDQGSIPKEVLKQYEQLGNDIVTLDNEKLGALKNKTDVLTELEAIETQLYEKIEAKKAIEESFKGISLIPEAKAHYEDHDGVMLSPSLVKVAEWKPTDCVPYGEDPELFDGGNYISWNSCVYKIAERIYNVPWQILSAVHLVESGRRNYFKYTNYAGANGPFQFLWPTWEAYKQDGNGDDIMDVYAFHDGLYGAANYLKANYDRGEKNGEYYCGYDWGYAVFRYNNACWYVDKVMDQAVIMGYEL